MFDTQGKQDVDLFISCFVASSLWTQDMLFFVRIILVLFFPFWLSLCYFFRLDYLYVIFVVQIIHVLFFVKIIYLLFFFVQTLIFNSDYLCVIFLFGVSLCYFFRWTIHLLFFRSDYHCVIFLFEISCVILLLWFL